MKSEIESKRTHSEMIANSLSSNTIETIQETIFSWTILNTEFLELFATIRIVNRLYS